MNALHSFEVACSLCEREHGSGAAGCMSGSSRTGAMAFGLGFLGFLAGSLTRRYY